MLLTDADFKKIKRLKKRQEDERLMKQANGPKNEQLAVHMPGFNFMEKRNELKMMTNAMRKKMDQEEEEGLEEGDEEGDEEGEEGDEEGMDEEDMGDEEGEEEGEYMDEEGEEEDDGEEEGGMEEEELDLYRKPSGNNKKKAPNTKNSKKFKEDEVKEAEPQEDEINSSFFDESDEENDPRAGFLSSNAIFDPEVSKKRATRD